MVRWGERFKRPCLFVAKPMTSSTVLLLWWRDYSSMQPVYADSLCCLSMLTLYATQMESTR